MLASTFTLFLPASLFAFVAVRGQGSNVTSVVDVFPQLANIPTISRNPHLGGQSFDKRCCLLAVNESLSVINGSVVLIKPSIINLDAATLQQGQFPCDAHYEDNHKGAPEVWVPYQWCTTNCAGWELSGNNHKNQWVVPFVGFIVPAVVFCLTVPRRYKLSVSDRLFDVDLNKICQVPMVPFLAIAAGLWVIVDTLIWVAVAFAFSGPMLLSGFYEGRLDQRLLVYLRQSIDNNRLDLRVRAQILFIILVGNLDVDSGDHENWSAWDDVRDLVRELEPRPAAGGSISKSAIERTKVRLRAMLACQYSFGTMTGAPVVFYTAAFVYTIFDVYNRLGDHDTSLALAFGIWWMTIPHLSIIGACLLAGNNPNTLEGIVGHGARRGSIKLSDDHDDNTLESSTITVARGFYGRIHRFRPRYVPVYQSIYQPASMWNRGQSKRKWINMLCDECGLRRLKRDCELHKRDWISVAGGAMFLTFIPSFLAFFQNYFTLRVGIGCRAATVLFYMVFQFLLMLLWLWELKIQEGRKGVAVGGITVRALLVVSCAIPTIFIAVGGTMMQIMGVYRNCLCYLNIADWISKKSPLMVSSNTPLHIKYARSTWLPLGITATAFLAVVSYIGWWYQRHLRFQFRNLVNRFDDEPTQDGE